MNTVCARLLISLLLTLLLPFESFAFELPLEEHTIRDAYFLGQRNDQKTNAELKPYIHALPLPQKGPYISEIRLYTPYAQVIDLSRTHTQGYSAQQAAADYHSHPDTILLRVRIEFTPTYGSIESDRDSRDLNSEKGITLRPGDFWQTFNIGLSQNDQWIEPVHRHGEPTFAATEQGGGSMTGALVWLEFDAHEVASEVVTAEVFTPDGQHVLTTFDLAVLR
jgi:hypothetical protein